MFVLKYWQFVLYDGDESGSEKSKIMMISPKTIIYKPSSMVPVKVLYFSFGMHTFQVISKFLGVHI